MIEMTEYMKRQIEGKRRIGAGGTRVVYDLGNGYVFKIARSKYGILCNRMEVKLYRTSIPRLKKHLAKIIDYDRAYRWVTMKKHDIHFPNHSIYRRKLMKLVKMFEANGIIPSEGVRRYDKPYRPNLRLKRDKRIVVIDYGGFKYGHK